MSGILGTNYGDFAKQVPNKREYDQNTMQAAADAGKAYVDAITGFATPHARKDPLNPMAYVKDVNEFFEPAAQMASDEISGEEEYPAWAYGLASLPVVGKLGKPVAKAVKGSKGAAQPLMEAIDRLGKGKKNAGANPYEVFGNYETYKITATNPKTGETVVREIPGSADARNIYDGFRDNGWNASVEGLKTASELQTPGVLFDDIAKGKVTLGGRDADAVIKDYNARDKVYWENVKRENQLSLKAKLGNATEDELKELSDLKIRNQADLYQLNEVAKTFSDNEWLRNFAKENLVPAKDFVWKHPNGEIMTVRARDIDEATELINKEVEKIGGVPHTAEISDGSRGRYFVYANPTEDGYVLSGSRGKNDKYFDNLEEAQAYMNKFPKYGYERGLMDEYKFLKAPTMKKVQPATKPTGVFVDDIVKAEVPYDNKLSYMTNGELQKEYEKAVKNGASEDIIDKIVREADSRGVKGTGSVFKETGNGKYTFLDDRPNRLLADTPAGSYNVEFVPGEGSILGNGKKNFK